MYAPLVSLFQHAAAALQFHKHFRAFTPRPHGTPTKESA